MVLGLGIGAGVGLGLEVRVGLGMAPSGRYECHRLHVGDGHGRGIHHVCGIGIVIHGGMRVGGHRHVLWLHRLAVVILLGVGGVRSEAFLGLV